VDRLGNQAHPMIRTLFPNNDAVFQGNSAPIHTAGSVKSWFEEHERELKHLPWPAQSTHLNIIEPLWSVLETRLRNRFPSPTSLKQLEDFLQEEWCKIQLETVRIHSKDCGCIECKRWSVQQHIHKEMCTVSVVFPLFCPIRVYKFKYAGLEVFSFPCFAGSLI
jgi:hypothetical protein